MLRKKVLQRAEARSTAPVEAILTAVPVHP